MGEGGQLKEQEAGRKGEKQTEDKDRRRKRRRRRCAVGTFRLSSHSGGDVDLRTEAVDGRNNRNSSLSAAGGVKLVHQSSGLQPSFGTLPHDAISMLVQGLFAKWMEEIIATPHYAAAQFQSTGADQH